MLEEPGEALASRVFAIIDRRDADAFAALFDEGGSFRFGNAPACHGPVAIGEFVRHFYALLESLEHRIEAVRSAPAGYRYFHVAVRYRASGQQTDWIPALVAAGIGDKGFLNYEIYVDPAPLNALLGDA